MAAVKLFFYLIILTIFFNKLYAEPISGNIVVLQILDKITARISTVEILVGKNIKFGSLEIKIYHCKKRPPEEIPEDFVLIQITDEISPNNYHLAFQGWMLSSSPTVNPFEHPTYDVWVKDCKIDIDSE